MIDLNKNQKFDPPIELEVSNDGKSWSDESINVIDHSLSLPHLLVDHTGMVLKEYKYARHPQPKNIDTTKPQVFDPPVKMLVSDDSFRTSCERDVICIYPGINMPIIVKVGKAVSLYRDAKPLPEPVTVEVEIEDTFNKMFKAAFDKAWKENITDLCENVAKKILEAKP